MIVSEGRQQKRVVQPDPFFFFFFFFFERISTRCLSCPKSEDVADGLHKTSGSSRVSSLTSPDLPERRESEGGSRFHESLKGKTLEDV